MGKNIMAFDPGDIVCEDKSKRTEREKHYMLKDGSYVAEIYNFPVHFRDKKDNRYHTVNNTLEKKDGVYENVKGAFKARLPESLKNGESIMKLEKDGRSIEWEYLNPKKRRFEKGKVIQIPERHKRYYSQRF